MVVGHYTSLHLQDAGKLSHFTHICMYVCTVLQDGSTYSVTEE